MDPARCGDPRRPISADEIAAKARGAKIFSPTSPTFAMVRLVRRANVDLTRGCGRSKRLQDAEVGPPAVRSLVGLPTICPEAPPRFG